MELDFAAVKALSSPTRIQILRAVLDSDRTPTELGDELDRSKSTISSHLSTLEDAGLLERDEEEGRRRVTYSPTPKAEAIVKGRERKVRFSVASSAISAVAGAVLVGSSLWNRYTPSMEEAGALTADTPGTMDQAGKEAAGLLTPETAVVGLGIVALLAAVTALAYAFVLHRLD